MQFITGYWEYVATTQAFLYQLMKAANRAWFSPKLEIAEH